MTVLYIVASRFQVLDLLPNAKENADLLKNRIDEIAGRLAVIADQWESHRVQLIEEYRGLKVSFPSIYFKCHSLCSFQQ